MRPQSITTKLGDIMWDITIIKKKIYVLNKNLTFSRLQLLYSRKGNKTVNRTTPQYKRMFVLSSSTKYA